MQNKLRSLALLVALALAGGVAFTGCQTARSPALSQGASASNSIQSAADTIAGARLQINTTLAALRNLTERPADIPAQYKTALGEIARLKATAAKIASAADSMRSKGDAYLADWARQVAAIGTPDLRAAALDRRAEVAARLQGIFQSYQVTKGHYEPFQASLADIQAVLGADLTLKGLETVKPYLAKAAAAAEPLKVDLDKLAAEFRAVGLSLQPGAAQ